MVAGRVLLTGASGLLGGWLIRTAPAGCDLVGVVHTGTVSDVPVVRVDLRDAGAVRAAVREVRPAFVIHAAYAKDHASIVDATQHVVDAADDVGAPVMLTSTDAVLPGDGTPQDEDTTPEPVWDYGRWKASAERIVAGSPGSTIVRLPLVVSVAPDDPAVQQIRAGAASGETTSWFADEIRQPARAEELAEALWRIAALDPTARTGAWHLPGPESLSRYEIAQRVVAVLGLDSEVIAPAATPPSADRPRHLNMRDDRAKREIGWTPSPI